MTPDAPEGTPPGRATPWPRKPALAWRPIGPDDSLEAILVGIRHWVACLSEAAGQLDTDRNRGRADHRVQFAELLEATFKSSANSQRLLAIVTLTKQIGDTRDPWRTVANLHKNHALSEQIGTAPPGVMVVCFARYDGGPGGTPPSMWQLWVLEITTDPRASAPFEYMRQYPLVIWSSEAPGSIPEKAPMPVDVPAAPPVRPVEDRQAAVPAVPPATAQSPAETVSASEPVRVATPSTRRPPSPPPTPLRSRRMAATRRSASTPARSVRHSRKRPAVTTAPPTLIQWLRLGGNASGERSWLGTMAHIVLGVAAVYLMLGLVFSQVFAGLQGWLARALSFASRWVSILPGIS